MSVDNRTGICECKYTFTLSQDSAMHFVTYLPHLLALSLAVLVPIVGDRYDRRLKVYTSAERRIGWYRTTIIVGCGLAAAAVAICYPLNLFVAPTGSPASWLLEHPATFFGAAIITVLYAGLVLGQGLRAIGNPVFRGRINKTMRSLEFALPVSARERRWWLLVSLSAGVCEEVLYRGFLMHYLSGSLAGSPALGSARALLISSTVFGLSHTYQGITGVFRTGLSGLLLGLATLLTGNLLVPIMLHILFDMQMLWMYRPQRDAPDSAARLIEGRTA